MKALQYLNKYFIKYKWRLLLGVSITFLSKIVTLEIPDIVGNSLNEVASYVTAKSNANTLALVKEILLKNILFLIGATVLGGFFTFLMRQTIIVMSRLIEFDLKNEIYQQYQQLSVNFYKKNRTGDLMNRISEDVSKVRMYFGPAIMYTLNMLVSFVVGFSKMYSISPQLTWYTMLPFPILSISIFFLSKEINKKSVVVQEYLSKLTTYTQEFFSGIRVVKSYAVEELIEIDFEGLVQESKDKNLELHKVQALFFPLMIFLIGISNILVLYIGGRLFIAGKIEIGAIASFVMYVNILTWPVAVVGWVTSIVQQAEASQHRINEFLKEEPEIVNAKEELQHFNGKIEFKNVSLTYDDTNITALKNISFTVNPGETIAVLGKTGSGKSSILNLVARLYDATEGTVFIDDIPVKEANLYSVRDHIGFVPQDPFLFSDTIANNIKFGKENATELEITTAAKNAAVHANIVGFKQGYETVLGERGVTLSGGQKQRVSIARAVIKDPKILIFDDCLSAVDTDTEAKILANLDALATKKTTFIISHRVSSVKNADKIVVLEAGEIVQKGVHNQLIKEEGYYKELYTQQLLEKEI